MSRSTACRLFFSTLFAAGFLTGCAGHSPLKPFFSAGSLPPAAIPVANLEPPPPHKPASYWEGEGATGAPQIVVNLGEQRGFFYRGKKVVGVTRVSSGKKGFSTPPGSYRVIQKHKDHVSTLYGDFVGEEGAVVKSNVDSSKDRPPEGAKFRGAKMPYFLRFHAGYGLHAGRVPSYPASHGCVRLPAEMARHFFANAEMGTPVRVEE